MYLLPIVCFLFTQIYFSSASVSRDSHGPLRTWLDRIASASRSDGGRTSSWIWGWAWGADNTVTVVERSPPISFPSRPASFGHMIEDPLMGYGIPMNAFTISCQDYSDNINSTNNQGCSKLCLVEGRTKPAEDAWVAIVQRGKCSFVEKVREAQTWGAKAVVVGGDDPNISGNPDVLVNMYSQNDASDVKIPSTYIRFSDYTHLINLIASSNTSTSGLRTVSLQITSDYASWEWYSPILTFIILLVLPSALTLATLLIHRLRAARAERRERAPEDVVQRLPWRVWTGSGWEKHSGPVHTLRKMGADLEANAEDLSASTSHVCETGLLTGDTESINPPWFDEQTECAICLNDFERGDRVRVLPCKHIFHLDEIDEWLVRQRKLCPVCKADVTNPEHPYPDDSHEQTPPPPPPPLTAAGSDATSVIPDERTPLLFQSQNSHDEDEEALSDPH